MPVPSSLVSGPNLAGLCAVALKNLPSPGQNSKAPQIKLQQREHLFGLWAVFR